MTTEMGKPIAQARAEAAKCAKAMRWYAEPRRGAARRRGTRPPPTSRTPGASRAVVRYRPLGPVLAVMPWNFPLWQVDPLRRARADGGQRGPAQARLERAADRALSGGPVPPGGLPRGLLPDAADRLGRRRGHPARPPGARRPPSPAASPPAARWRPSPGTRSRRRCWSSAAATRTSCCRPPTSTGPPQIAVTARVQNNGQSCIAAKRFIVHTDVYDAFAERFIDSHGGAEGRRPAGRGHRRRAALQRTGPRGPGGAGGRRGARAARRCCAAANVPTGSRTAAGTTRRRSSPTSPARCASTRRRPSARSPTLYRAADLDEAVGDRQRHALRPQFERVDPRRGRGATVSCGTWRRAACSSTG